MTLKYTNKDWTSDAIVGNVEGLLSNHHPPHTPCPAWGGHDRH